MSSEVIAIAMMSFVGHCPCNAACCQNLWPLVFVAPSTLFRNYTSSSVNCQLTKKQPI